jgi:hypothetical protein
MYTPFDWRIGVLDGKPLFAARYHMCKDHWQIIKHAANGNFQEGRVESVPLSEVPLSILELASKSANLIGDGLYGIDIKSNEEQSFVIEVNDNPNIDIGMEDAHEGDEVYRKILLHLLYRFELRHNISTKNGTGKLTQSSHHAESKSVISVHSSLHGNPDAKNALKIGKKVDGEKLSVSP